MTHRRRAGAAIGAVLALSLLGGCGTLAAEPGTTAASTPHATQPVRAGWAPAGTLSTPAARVALDRLNVAQEGSQAGYQRSCAKGSGCVFGAAWTDTDHNGCDQRDDVLTRDLTATATKPGTHDCVVISGTLSDPYTGQAIAFTKDHASAVQIDHVVVLGEAWRSGASSWPQDKRTALANDLANLVAVDGSANESKGDDGPAEWMPPAQVAHCGYGRITITVKAKYSLTITAQDKAALTAALASCPAGS